MLRLRSLWASKGNLEGPLFISGRNEERTRKSGENEPVMKHKSTTIDVAGVSENGGVIEQLKSYQKTTVDT